MKIKHAFVKFVDSFVPYIRTIRFKLAFLYSCILFLFTGSLVLGFNIFLGNNLHKDPDSRVIQVIPFGAPQLFLFDDFNKLQGEERQRIRNIRLNDLRKVQELSILSLFPLAILSFYAGYYLSGKFLEPISRLKKDIEKIESKDLGIRFASSENDEVGALIQSFNALSARLQEAFHSQEQFVQDASHELRTPLTIIQTNLDTILDNSTATKEEMAIAVNQALVGVRQLNKLVNYLLELTTVAKYEFKNVDIAQIVSSQISMLSSNMAKANITLNFDKKGTTTPLVKGDELLLGRVFFNIIENAIRYSSHDDNNKGIISITQTQNNNFVTIDISNPGIAIPEEKMNKLFERFYQIDPSRSKKLGGYGLGLSIVKKIILEHQGKISAHHEHGVTTFEVTLPIAK